MSNADLEQVFDHLLKYGIKILLEYFNKNWEQKILLNRQLEMRVYLKTVAIRALKAVNFPT
jgi:hypothetical protein